MFNSVGEQEQHRLRQLAERVVTHLRDAGLPAAIESLSEPDTWGMNTAGGVVVEIYPIAPSAGVYFHWKVSPRWRKELEGHLRDNDSEHPSIGLMRRTDEVMRQAISSILTEFGLEVRATDLDEWPLQAEVRDPGHDRDVEEPR